MQIIDTIQDAVDSLVKKTGRFAVAALGIILLLAACALMILTARSFTKKKKALPVVQAEFQSEDEFIPPSNIKLTEDYYFSREPKENWTREEIDRWFSKPNKVNMNELKQANDRLVEEIIGAVP